MYYLFNLSVNYFGSDVDVHFLDEKILSYYYNYFMAIIIFLPGNIYIFPYTNKIPQSKYVGIYQFIIYLM